MKKNIYFLMIFVLILFGICNKVDAAGKGANTTELSQYIIMKNVGLDEVKKLIKSGTFSGQSMPSVSGERLDMYECQDCLDYSVSDTSVYITGATAFGEDTYNMKKAKKLASEGNKCSSVAVAMGKISAEVANDQYMAYYKKHLNSNDGNGSYEQPLAHAMIRTVTRNVLSDWLILLMNESSSQCKDSKTFNFEGDTFDCSLVTQDTEEELYKNNLAPIDCMTNGIVDANRRELGALEEHYYAKNETYNIGKIPTVEEISEANKKYNEKFGGSSKGFAATLKSLKNTINNALTQGGKSDLTGSGENKDDVNTNNTSSNKVQYEQVQLFYKYEEGEAPSIELKDLIKITKKAEKTGDNSGLVSEFNEFILGANGSIIDLVSRIGRYIIYVVILILGVRCIWDGADGRARVKEILPFLLIAIIFFFAAPGIVNLFETTFDMSNSDNFGIDIFNTATYILRILAFAGMIFTGTKYIFAAAKEKAEIKQKMLSIIIGCVFVFASTFVVEVVVKSANEAGIESDIKLLD